MNTLSRPKLLNWSANGVLFLIFAWVMYHNVYQPFAQGESFDALLSAGLIIVLFGIAFFARRKAESMDFRRR